MVLLVQRILKVEIFLAQPVCALIKTNLGSTYKSILKFKTTTVQFFLGLMLKSRFWNQSSIFWKCRSTILNSEKWKWQRKLFLSTVIFIRYVSQFSYDVTETVRHFWHWVVSLSCNFCTTIIKHQVATKVWNKNMFLFLKINKFWAYFTGNCFLWIPFCMTRILQIQTVWYILRRLKQRDQILRKTDTTQWIKRCVE